MSSLLLACMTILGAQTDSGPVLSPVDLQEDFKILRTALEEGHPGIYRYTAKKEMDDAFAKSFRELDHPTSTLEIFRTVSLILAKVKCGHTAAGVDNPLLISNQPLLPIQPRMVGGKLFVWNVYSSEYPDLRGAEILSINGMRAKEISKLVLASRSRDGDSMSRPNFDVSRSTRFAKAVRIFTPLRAPFRVNLLVQGKRRDIELPGMSAGDQEIADQRLTGKTPQPSSPISLEFKQDGKVAVLAVKSFVDNKGPAFFKSEFVRLFTEIEKQKCSSLIIDVRGNGGGFDDSGKDLLAHLVGHRFEYYDDLTLNRYNFSFEKYLAEPLLLKETGDIVRPDGSIFKGGHPNTGTQNPQQPQFKGRIIALMDGGSFSTTGEFLSVLHGLHIAKFVGEESAAGVTGNNSGDTAVLILPHSKIKVRIPLVKYVVHSGPVKFRNRGVLPDYRVDPTIQDLMDGQDPAMLKALSLAQ